MMMNLNLHICHVVNGKSDFSISCKSFNVQQTSYFLVEKIAHFPARVCALFFTHVPVYYTVYTYISDNVTHILIE